MATKAKKSGKTVPQAKRSGLKWTVNREKDTYTSTDGRFLVRPQGEEYTLSDGGKDVYGGTLTECRRQAHELCEEATTPEPDHTPEPIPPTKAKGKKTPAVKENKPSPAPQPADKGTLSNKGQVYTAWVEGDREVAAAILFDLVQSAVKKSTIIGWVSAWKRGQNLPAVAKQAK